MILSAVTDDNEVKIQDSQGMFSSDKITVVQDDTPEELEDIVCSNLVIEGTCVDLIIESVIPEQPKIAKSNDSFVQQFLDSIAGTKTIGIETVATVYDLAGKTKSKSSIFPVPLSLELEDGFFPDNIQVAFFAISQERVSALELEGTVEFRLDDEKVSSDKYRLWTSANVVDQAQIPLVVTTSSLPPPAINRPDTFDFTFSDEGFADGIEHTFSVIITKLSGNLNGDDFNWNGFHTAYELKMTVDESKIIILSESGDAIPIFKSDSTISSCSTSGYVLEKTISQGGGTAFYNVNVPATTSLELIVQDTEGNELGKINEFVSTATGEKITGTKSATKPVLDCKSITLTRNTPYVFIINGESSELTTPQTQQNYYAEYKRIDADGKSPRIDLNVFCSSWRDIGHCAHGASVSYQARPLNAIYEQVTSNFGFEYNSVPCDGAKNKIGAVADRGRFGTTNHETILTFNDLDDKVKNHCLS